MSLRLKGLRPHAPDHEDVGGDEISVSGLAGRQIVIPKNAKIADITHTDTSKHTLDLATALSETRTIISLIIGANRVSGTGGFVAYPNEGTNAAMIGAADYDSRTIVIAAGTQRLQYNLSTAKDDFDLYCYGYTVVSA